MDINSKNGGDLALQSQPQATVKQEKLEPVESTNENSDLIPDSQSYILQQQQLQYETDFQYKELKESNADSMANVSENSDEPIAKRPRRRRQATKPVPPESLDSSDNDNDAGDSMLEMTVTKTEEESESDGDENVDDPEPAKYGSAGDDTEQPGPSGLGKGGTDAPKNPHGKKRKYENVLRLRCTACYKISNTQEDLEDHYLTHESKYNCHLCQEKFKCLYYCSLHMSEHYGKNFTCCVCSHTTPNKSNLLIHINTIHLKRYLFYCDECGKGFNNKVIKAEHELYHKKDKSRICVVCAKQYCYTGDLVAHQRRVHNVTISGSDNRCSICKKEFAKKSRLETHIRNVHNSICDRCGRSFYNTQKLKLHMRIHTGIKPFACSACDKRFIKKEVLDQHSRTHTGEKPYACEHCGKCFSQRTPLRIHTRIHTGEKPYVCRFCSKAYMSSGALSVHMKACTGDTSRKSKRKMDNNDENYSDD